MLSSRQIEFPFLNTFTFGWILVFQTAAKAAVFSCWHGNFKQNVMFCFDHLGPRNQRQISVRTAMTQETNPPTFTAAEVKEQLTNDSLGTIDSADSSGSDPTKDNGDGKHGKTTTRED
jgi:hypothetical protein